MQKLTRAETSSCNTCSSVFDMLNCSDRASISDAIFSFLNITSSFSVYAAANSSSKEETAVSYSNVRTSSFLFSS